MKSKVPALAKFQKLFDDISRIYESARQAQVRFAWEIGRRVFEVEQDGDIHARYGTSLIPQLSRKLTKKYGVGFSERNLSNMRRFYLENKKLQPAAKLTWTNQVELMRVKDPRARDSLKARVIKEDLGKYEVRKIVTTINQSASQTPVDLPPLKRPTDLKLNTFRKSKLRSKLKDGDVLIDCGFVVNWPVSQEELKGVNLTDTPSYTYEAAIDRVIDGDTLLVIIEVGFRIKVYDKLRLRGIDCPELGTPEGEKAKRFVAELLPVGSVIILKSHKTRTDTYGRFVADVFFKTGENNCDNIIRDGIYLNQHLLDQGLAVRMKE